MPKYFTFFLVLGLVSPIKCELSLKILKSIGDSYIPVQSHTVEEKVGTNFSLLCDLVSTENDSFDWQISWIRPSQNDIRFWKEEDVDTTMQKKMYSILTPSDINKAVKRFQPLKPDDKGKYICVSLKYNLLKSVEVIVRDDTPRFEVRPMHETFLCSEQMFQCLNGYCIYLRYVCDGKKDCKDGSDESYENCNGDPCKDKLHCDDGRCIPTTWCCDRHLDPNCTVLNRPECCQILSNSYEERDHGATNLVHSQNNSARYVFISVCILSILFFIVLLFLVLSRVVIFAKKTSLQRNSPHHHHHHHHHPLHPSRHSNIESIALHTPYAFQTSHIVLESCDVSDPLLHPINYNNNNSRSSNRDEQPPPYVDAIRELGMNLNEPPPPYTSRDALNNS